MKYILTLIVVLLNQTAFSQTFNPRDLNPSLGMYPPRFDLYVGIDNKFMINSLIRDSKWEIETSNGTAQINSDNFVTIHPEKTGKAEVSIFYIHENNKKSLAFSYSLSVITLPMPEIKLGKVNKINKSELLALKSLTLVVPEYVYFLSYFIKSGSLLIISASGKRKEVPLVGNIVTAEMKDSFKATTKGDIIIFKDIIAIRENSDIDEIVKGTWLMVE